MTDTSPDSRVAAEEQRIRSVYAARDWSRYSLLDPANIALLQDRERRTLAMLRSGGVPPLHELEILDLGCGSGQWLADLVRWGASPARLVGVDIRRDGLADAARRLPAAVRLISASGTATGLRGGQFDLVVMATVLSSVLDMDVRHSIAREASRLLKPAGAILWYDFHVNNPGNPDVRRVSRSELSQLFPGCVLTLTRATLAPPLARLAAPRSELLARVLGAVPWLRTHYVGLIRRS